MTEDQQGKGMVKVHVFILFYETQIIPVNYCVLYFKSSLINLTDKCCTFFSLSKNSNFFFFIAPLVHCGLSGTG